MYLKVIGAALIVIGCGGFGFSLVRSSRREERLLLEMIAVLNFMECELQYRLTPLPNLCAIAGKQSRGELGCVLTQLSKELDDQVSPDAHICMINALGKFPSIPEKCCKHLKSLGQCLGRFDLTGQLSGLDYVRRNCRNDLEELRKNKDVRIRNYQTLALCAGAALAILLI